MGERLMSEDIFYGFISITDVVSGAKGSGLT